MEESCVDKEMEDSLGEVSSELDRMSIQMLCLMKEYIDCKVNIEDLIKSGSLHLAKSRYIMGNRCVSALQLPTEDGSDICARTTLVRSKKTTASLENIALELDKMVLSDANPGLKSRAKGEAKPTKEEDDAKPQDPLKWFGVLVPQNLRHAQTYFTKAIHYVVQCANIQLEMAATHKRFKKFYSRKKKILQAQSTQE